jgi:hypothetical protein
MQAQVVMSERSSYSSTSWDLQHEIAVTHQVYDSLSDSFDDFCDAIGN